MTNKEPELVPYEHTLYDFLAQVIVRKKRLIEALNGKDDQSIIIALNGLYLQNINTPSLIAYIPEDKPENVHRPKINEGNLSVWFYHGGHRDGTLSFEEFKNYAVISEKQFNELKEGGYHLGLYGFNYKLIKEKKKSLLERIFNNNKANLSADKNKRSGIIVAKSKATRKFNTRETQFTKNSRLNH